MKEEVPVYYLSRWLKKIVKGSDRYEKSREKFA